MKPVAAVVLAALFASARSQDNITFLTDSGVLGPPLETAHAYYDQWPTGIAVSSTGRLFSNYPGGLDPNNVNRGGNSTIYTVAELTSLTTETPYPSAEMNSPPGGAINYTTTPPTGANYQDYLIGVQSVVIDPEDRLWILDTGRVLLPDGTTLVSSSYGGPKLIAVDLTTNTVIQTILFPQTVAYPDTYLNDVRFDLRPSLTESGKGVAYITDSSTEGRNGLIIVDLGTGESWRHINGAESVRADTGFVGFVSGQSVYFNSGPSPGQFTYLPLGSDGIALAADGKDLYWGPISSRRLYSVSTSLLRDRGPMSEVLAQGGVRYHGQKGFSDGFETDSNGLIYMGNIEQNAVVAFNPKNGTVNTFVRDPRINWSDTFSVSTDGYLYFTSNQLHLLASYPGTDRRVKPYALFKVKLPDGGSKVILT